MFKRKEDEVFWNSYLGVFIIGVYVSFLMLSIQGITKRLDRVIEHLESRQIELVEEVKPLKRAEPFLVVDKPTVR